MAATSCIGMVTLLRKLVNILIALLCVRATLTLAILGPPSISMGRFAGMNNNLQNSKNLQIEGKAVDDEETKEVGFRYRDTKNATDISLLASLLEMTSNAAATGAVAVTDQLTYMQTMTAGALSRTMAQTLMHPANTYKTLLQLRGSGKPGGILTKLTPERLLRGVDAQFIMSLPHGAFYFFVIDQVKTRLSGVMSSKFNFLQDFAASTISTVFCSIVSTPQMVLTDRLMAGVYPTSMDAVKSILRAEGVAGFYTGWWPALAQKIPSYG